MVRPSQGDLFWIQVQGKRRPALVVTRSQAIPVLNRVLIAPVTRSIRGIPTEIRLEKSHGLREESVAALDNMELIPTGSLTEKIGSLANPKMEICRALGALANC